MALFYEPLAGIDAKAITDLVDNQVAEDLHLEFKQRVPGNSDSEKKEFLYDVSSFANASGGLVVIGIREDAGVAVGIEEIKTEDADSVIARLDSMVREGIGPRIVGFRCHFVKVGDASGVVLVRIPASWSGPHWVTFKSDFRFYTRHSNGKHPMDLSELRASFTLAGGLTQRVRTFRDERLIQIQNKETPFPLQPGALVCLHLVPASALVLGAVVPVATTELDLHQSSPIYGFGAFSRPNFDGYATAAPGGDNTHGGYCQFYRSGIVEAVDASLLEPMRGQEKVIPHQQVEQDLMNALERYLKIQQSFGIEPPIFVALTLIGVNGFRMADRRSLHQEMRLIDRSTLKLEAVCESMSIDPAELMRPLFDQIWNAAGWKKSPNFNAAGRWDPN